MVVDEMPTQKTTPKKAPRRSSLPLPDTEQEEFDRLIVMYNDHQRLMQMSFNTFDQFLNELANGKRFRKMIPQDVGKLAAVELVGLLYWIEKLHPFTDLPAEDKEVLLKRYSVRKLSLDHFHSASKHPDFCARRDFVMNNYTFIPSNRTGFELPKDDNHQIEAKRLLFSETFDYFWTNIIDPFVAMKINDSEIVFIHIMLLWSSKNLQLVTKFTRGIMQKQRDWALNRLFSWYRTNKIEEPELRLAKVIDLLGEIESVCEKHCQDFQVAKLFEFCDMSMFWYDAVCYAPCNTDSFNYQPNLMETLGKINEMILRGMQPEEIFKKLARENPDKGNSDGVDPALLKYNAQMLHNVLAPLPDDNFPAQLQPLIEGMGQVQMEEGPP